ncbi:hypothetical protein H4R18_000751 [Coemansia javaensis]|uniref:Glutaredoxin-like protein n=1 Tax=Coemansia javaensis TaxID=2761396 RepID=A0A9W8LK58_9FUNG|nr:hypothetical protein H4R18_000751 [Coemansia javaensis]
MSGRGAARLALTLFTHRRCQLCVDAKAALAEVRAEVPFELSEVDIHKPGNERWLEEYKHDVPVVHANGEFLLWHRVDVPRTIAQLRTLRDGGKVWPS